MSPCSSSIPRSSPPPVAPSAEDKASLAFSRFRTRPLTLYLPVEARLAAPNNPKHQKTSWNEHKGETDERACGKGCATLHETDSYRFSRTGLCSASATQAVDSCCACKVVPREPSRPSASVGARAKTRSFRQLKCVQQYIHTFESPSARYHPKRQQRPQHLPPQRLPPLTLPRLSNACCCCCCHVPLQGSTARRAVRHPRYRVAKQPLVAENTPGPRRVSQHRAFFQELRIPPEKTLMLNGILPYVPVCRYRMHQEITTNCRQPVIYGC